MRAIQRGGARAVASFVRVARLRDDAEILRVFAGDEVRESAFATLRVVGALDHVLRREDRLLSVVREETNASLEKGH